MDLDLEDLKTRLRQACGRTTGHGERCAPGWECAACDEKKQAADAIEQLQADKARLERELEEARKELKGM